MGAVSKIKLHSLAAAAAAIFLCAAPGGGDVFILRGGARLEGELLGRDEKLVRIRTDQAEVAVSADDVVSIEQNPSSAIYERLAREFPDTAEGHYRLGLWCRERELTDLAEAEFRKAIARDGNHAAARAALGHVKIGQAWLEPSPQVGPKPPRELTDKPVAMPAPPAASQPDQRQRELDLARASLHEAEREMRQTLRAEWLRRIQAIQLHYLSSSVRRQTNQGADLLLAIRDPLAVEPMIQTLGNGTAEQRKLLMTALGQFQTSVATMALLEAAVLDEDADVRKTALTQLQPRRDSRISGFLVKALASDDNDVMSNAAEALGQLRIVSAIPSLVKELTAKEVRRVKTEVVVQTMRQQFIDQTGQLRTMVIRRKQSDPFHDRTVTVKTYRTVVQDALIAITGENYGFDADAWMAWYRRHGASRDGIGR